MSNPYLKSKLSPVQTAVLDGYFGRGVMVKPAVVRALKGNGNAAILLSQFIYLTLKNDYDEREGWFYNTQTEIEEMTGLGTDSQKTARHKLVKLGILEETKNTIGNRLHYRINLHKVAEILVPQENTGTPDSSLREPPILEQSNPRFSYTKTSSKTSTKTYSSFQENDTPPHGDKPQHQQNTSTALTKKTTQPTNESIQLIYDTWNTHCGVLPKVTRNKEAAKLIKTELKTRTLDELTNAITLGAQEVAQDPYWREKRYGIVNLLRHLDDKLEKATHANGYTGADANAYANATNIWEAINALN